MINFFIQRPVFASTVAIIMVLAGLICLRVLPISQFPEITPPQIVVKATYPGASAQVVADTVTTPLEQQINGVPGMIYMSSVSANDGTSTITITFEVGYSANIAAVDVQNRISQAEGRLPNEVKQVGISGPHLIGPGWGPHFFLWSAFKEALKALPTVPSWPTWRP